MDSCFKLWNVLVLIKHDVGVFEAILLWPINLRLLIGGQYNFFVAFKGFVLFIRGEWY